jgi:membrane-bound lytic murein transglycosylase B
MRKGRTQDCHALIRCCIVALGIWFYPGLAVADWSPLIDRLVADGFDKGYLHTLFSRPEAAFDPDPMVVKLRTLLRTRDLKSPSPSDRPGKVIYKGYLQPAVINRAKAYYTENRTILSNVRRKYCIPEDVIVAILMVETQLGRNTGSRRAFNVLASMALTDKLDLVKDYLGEELRGQDAVVYAQNRCREKSAWAYEELKSLITYARNTKADPLAIPGSIYGAIGLCQFMPSNILLYGVDGDENGRIDLFSSPDALYSVGNYLKMKGWTCRMDKLSRYRVILTYNRSRVYANTVLALADHLRSRSWMSVHPNGRAKRKG